MPKLPDSGFTYTASFYDALAKFVYGDSLQQAQLALLPFIPQKARVLVIGGGSGWVLEQLIQTKKELNILYLDAAPSMLKLAQQKFEQQKHPHTCSVEFRLGNEQSLHPQEQFDVIFTPFLLDLFPAQRLHILMATLASALTPAGTWLFADFWPTQQPPPIWQRILIRCMYIFFGLISGVEANNLPDYKVHFDSLGFEVKYSKSFYSGMVQAKVYMRTR